MLYKKEVNNAYYLINLFVENLLFLKVSFLQSFLSKGSPDIGLHVKIYFAKRMSKAPTDIHSKIVIMRMTQQYNIARLLLTIR